MSTTNQARIELGIAASNIAGNIDVLLPQLASRGAEVAIAGNQIHDKIKALRQLGVDFQHSTADNLEPVAFDKAADDIDAVLPQLANHGVEVAAVANAIKGYTNQLRSVHEQHLHVVDPANATIIVVPHVNNGLGGAPFDTGTTFDIKPADTSKIDPIPQPAGDPNPKPQTQVTPPPQPVVIVPAVQPSPAKLIV